MRKIIEKAKKIYKKYGLDDLDFLVSRLGVKLYEILETEKIEEVYFPDLGAIAIKPGLPLYERNYLIIHALGHHLFHRIGLNRDYISLHEEGICKSLTLGRIEIATKEREADIFAAYLLIPEKKLNDLLKEEWTNDTPDLVGELAEEFQVPRELVIKRLEFKKLYEV
jgi:Zn-dependent peptidase ImmA (M78 family)